MIREMRVEDIPSVVEIEKSIFSAPWSAKSFQSALESDDNIYLVEVLENGIAGYCGVWTSYDTADLCNMAVALSQRRKGIAERLLMKAVDMSKSCHVERILLEVRESNEAAIALYEKNGFCRIGLRKGYYSAPTEDAILMECVISQ